MFVAIATGNNGGKPVSYDAGALLGKEYATADEAKKGAASLIAHSTYKPYFTNGYDILIIDMDAGKVVSRAKTEIKLLEWKDTPTT